MTFKKFLPALSCGILAISTAQVSAVTVSYNTSLISSIFDPSAADHDHTNGSLTLSSSNSITFNTDTNSFSGAASGTGTLFEDKSGTEYSIFNFFSVNISDGVSINVTGSKGFALLSETNLSLNSSITRQGADGAFGALNGNPGSSGNPISLVAKGTIDLGLSATLNTNGGNGADENDAGFGNGGNGGSGGSITLGASSLTLNGSLTAQGGSGGSGSGFGGGGGNDGLGGDILVAVDGVTSYTANNGGSPAGAQSVTTTPDYLSVPEPSSSVLLALGGCLALIRRKRQ